MPQRWAEEGAPETAAITMAIDVILEAGEWAEVPQIERLARQAVGAVLLEIEEMPGPGSEVAVILTDDASVRSLNARWRGKNVPTNVLSFPAFAPHSSLEIPRPLGDIVLAQETIAREAKEENKPFENHVVHLIVHGFLHLLGHDHKTEAEADLMESLERRALARLAIPDPYA